ncbi:efflux RND transporter periplasmic adaptor subunit [Pararcticibacter amylolyticus]|uniref:Efflux transporter periplasmic adaptor subunit n=1 Tax=Pararcticibacter amylolyticus TaxID=2173175 RepID=A0A2U2PFW2_9SPHI|nr:efflux RND transporter periplasmic adaptor subunit [Pararcticibacter amylolyticus]PWG80295.1 efflux transporter periplasmic adaptor subunit [Pararcticibacter amylolyticus]
MKKKINERLTLAAVLILVLFLQACGNRNTADSGETAAEENHTENENVAEITKAQYQSIGIVLGSAEMKAISGQLKVTGYIDVPPQGLISITTQMGGIVKSTPLLQGSSVRKGQVIAVLENQDYVQLQQDYLESKSQLSLTEAEYQRQQTLASQNVNSQKTLQQAKSQYQIAQARESALRQRLKLINIQASSLTASGIRSWINIYSPATGYVTKVNVNAGKFVNPNDVMFEIVDGSDLHVELNVFEKDAELVKPGQRVRFTLAGETTERYARIQLAGREIRPDKTITVHAIADGGNSFIPNTYLKAFIETGEIRALTLPQSAVTDFQGKKYIFVATDAPEHENGTHRDGDDDKETAEKAEPSAGEEKMFYFEMVAVTTGNADGELVQVDLPAGRDYKGTIVLKGTYDLLSKLKNSEEHEGH